MPTWDGAIKTLQAREVSREERERLKSQRVEKLKSKHAAYGDSLLLPLKASGGSIDGTLRYCYFFALPSDVLP